MESYYLIISVYPETDTISSREFPELLKKRLTEVWGNKWEHKNIDNIVELNSIYVYRGKRNGDIIEIFSKDENLVPYEYNYLLEKYDYYEYEDYFSTEYIINIGNNHSIENIVEKIDVIKDIFESIKCDIDVSKESLEMMIKNSQENNPTNFYKVLDENKTHFDEKYIMYF